MAGDALTNTLYQLERLITVPEAACYLGVDAKTLRDEVNKGELDVIALTGTPKGDRVHPADLVAYIDAKRTQRGIPEEWLYEKGKEKAELPTTKSVSRCRETALKERLGLE